MLNLFLSLPSKLSSHFCSFALILNSKMANLTLASILQQTKSYAGDENILLYHISAAKVKFTVVLPFLKEL